MNKKIVVAFASLTLLLSTSLPAFAQAMHEFFGPPTPLGFDSKGERHWMEYGYSGLWLPPIVEEKAVANATRGNHTPGALTLNHAPQPKAVLGRYVRPADLSKQTE